MPKINKILHVSRIKCLTVLTRLIACTPIRFRKSVNRRDLDKYRKVEIGLTGLIFAPTRNVSENRLYVLCERDIQIIPLTRYLINIYSCHKWLVLI